MIEIPNNIRWLLKVPVKPGEPVPYHCWLLWASQFVYGPRIPA